MKLRAESREFVAPGIEGSSVTYNPATLTGRSSSEYSSNQSFSPKAGAAIHSLIFRFAALPSAAGPLLVSPGVGKLSRAQPEPVCPIERSVSWKPKERASTTWPFVLERNTVAPSPGRENPVFSSAVALVEQGCVESHQTRRKLFAAIIVPAGKTHSSEASTPSRIPLRTKSVAAGLYSSSQSEVFPRES